MKKVFLLPLLAAIFAIGMSFTTLDNTVDPNQDYYLENGVFMPLGTELNCGSGTIICKVQRVPGGQLYEVYDSSTPPVLKRGNGTIQKLY